MKSIKQRLIDNEIDFKEAYIQHYNELTQEDIDYMVKTDPYWVVTRLNLHPFLTQEHVDNIVELIPGYAAQYLNQHPLLKQEHVDFIVKKEHGWAVFFLSHRLSEENITYLAENHPEILKEIFR